MTRQFGSGKEAMTFLFGREAASADDKKLEREIADALANPDPDKVAAYQDKLETKRDRLSARARKARGQAQLAFGTARGISDMIPMGQPILVGHHSERRHRKDLDKRDRAMRKGFELEDKAGSLASRAAAVGTAGISSDDPEAVKKLKRELEGLKLAQEQMKKGNAAIKKHARDGTPVQLAALLALGFSQRVAEMALRKDFGNNSTGFFVANGGANIRRVEKRIAELTEKAAAPARAPVAGSIEGLSFTLSESKDANRTQIVFSGKPSDDLRSKLKRAGFKWAPSIGAWQRHLSNQAWYQATHALGVS